MKLYSEKRTLVGSQAPLSSGFLSWFMERFYFITLIISVLMIMTNVGREIQILHAGWNLSFTVGIWLGGLYVYSMLRKKADSGQIEGRIQILNLLAGSSVVLTIFLSLLLQRQLGFSPSNLWPLFYLALFASAERLNGIYYGFLTALIWLALFALESSTPTDLFSLGFYLVNHEIITRCFAILLLSAILFFLVSSLKNRGVDVQALFDLSAIQGHQWYERQYSHYVLESINTVAKKLFRATSCEMIFVNGQTGLCYVRPVRDLSGIKIEEEMRTFFEPSGALLKAIHSRRAVWEDEANSVRNSRTIVTEWLLSLLPGKTSKTLYLPIKKHRGSNQVVTVLKLHLHPSILGSRRADNIWQDELEKTAQGFSALMEQREMVQAIRIIQQINLIAGGGKEASLYRAIANDYAYMFNCPTVIWNAIPESPEILRIQATSRWFVQSLIAKSYEKATIVVGEGKLGGIIAEAEDSSPVPISLLAKDTELARTYEKLGIHRLVLVPLVSRKGPIGAILLHILTENDLDTAEKHLIEILAAQTSLAIQHHRTRILYRDLPMLIQKQLTTSENDPGQIIDKLAKNAGNFLKADLVDLHLIDKESWAITKSRRATKKTKETVPLNVSKEEEELLLDAALQNFPKFFSHKQKGCGEFLPAQTKSYALLPLLAVGSPMGIIVAHYNKPNFFLLEQKFMHNVLSLLAEHTLGLMEYHIEIRRKLVSEAKEKMMNRVHESLSDTILAIRNWAQLAMLLDTENTRADDLSHYLNRINQLALDSYERLIQLPNELWSPEIDEVATKELTKAIEDYYHTLGPYGSIHVDSGNFLGSMVPLHLQVTILRICKLALSNIVRHASAKNAFVQININPKSILLNIKDDGVGFDTSIIQAPYSFGLRSIDEIVKDCGGLSQIASGSDTGTLINIEIPYE